MTTRSTNRRNVLTKGAALFGMSWFARSSHAMAASETFEISRPEAEWRKLLSPAAFNVLRKEGTERPYSSPLNDEKRSGLFHCGGCELPLYSSKTKYESGTGWPSFWASLDDSVRTKVDRGFLMTRTEVHCRRCGGHLGHIFDDGPKPTGKRHCLNGVALTFAPGSGEPSG